MSVLAGVRCSWCGELVEEHSLEQAWHCANELEYRESAGYCRLEGPKEFEFFNRLATAVAPGVAAMGRILANEHGTGERRSGPAPGDDATP